MAKNFYGFVERSAESQINWNEVGRQMSDVVNEEARVRTEKKAAIDADIQAFNDYINNPPLGDHQGFNEWTSKFAGDTAQYALQVERLLKSGQMRPSDYTGIRANLQQGSTEAFEFGKDFNAKYAELQQRKEIDPETGLPAAQALEEYLMESTRGLGNYSNTRLWINPTDGKVLLGKKDGEDGIMMQNPNDYAPVSQLRNRLNAKYDLYDVNKATEGIATQLGTSIDVIMRNNVETRENPLDNPEIVSAIDNAVQSQLANGFNVTSLLTNTLRVNNSLDENGNPIPGVTNEMFGFTQDPAAAAADPNLILMIDNQMQPDSGAVVSLFGQSEAELRKMMVESDTNPNGISEADFKKVMANRDAQLEQAGDAVETSIKSKLDIKEVAYEPREDRPLTNDEADRGANKKTLDSSLNNLAKFGFTKIPELPANATQADKDARDERVQQETTAALNNLANLNPLIDYIELTENQIIVYDVNEDDPNNPIKRTPMDKGKDPSLMVERIVTAVLPDDIRNAGNIAEMLKNTGIQDGMIRHNVVGRGGRAEQAIRPAAIPTPLQFGDMITDEDGEDASVKLVAQYAYPADTDVESKPLALRNSFSSFFNSVGITNAQILSSAGEDNTFSSDDVGVTSIAIPNVTEGGIILPANISQAQWLALNELLLKQRAANLIVTAKDLEGFIPNIMGYQEQEYKDRLGIGALD
tara:strand:+ start:1848 stop:3941 length:2094 start_codon:yes stop_codon:yes gene_type:complete